MGPVTASMDSLLRNAFVVEMENLLSEVKVINDEAPAGAPSEFWSSATGAPCDVVRTSAPSSAN